MKQKFIIVLLAFEIVSCEYNNSSPTKSSSPPKDDPLAFIEGRWTAEKDSFLIGSLGVNHLKTDSDYYNFDRDGLLLIKEGAKFDTATYAVTAENVLSIIFKEKVIVNRASGIYSVNKVSDNLLSLTTSGVLEAPVLPQGDYKIRAVISLKKH